MRFVGERRSLPFIESSEQGAAAVELLAEDLAMDFPVVENSECATLGPSILS
ncbi:MAG: hypothetical protein ACOCTH_00255 [Halodesulfurarchaeum sp.]